MLRVPCSPLFKDKSMQNLHCLRWASLATFQVVGIPLNTMPFFPLQVPKLSPEEFASNLAIKRKRSDFFVIKMTGTLQRPVCYYHLCQLPLKWARLPQPTNVLADERPFANQWVLSPFCWRSAWFCSGYCRHSIAPSFCEGQPSLLLPDWWGNRNGRPSSPSPGEKAFTLPGKFISFLPFSLTLLCERPRP